MSRQCLNGVGDDGLTPDGTELLRCIAPGATALSGGEHQRGDPVIAPCHRSACSERRAAPPDGLLAASPLFR